MTLLAGSVTVANDGTASGDGIALALYTSYVAMPCIAAQLALPDSVDFTQPRPWPAYLPAAGKLTIKRAQAEIANATSVVVTYFLANAEISGSATVSSQSLGLTPDPLAANTPILPPSAPVAIPLSGTLA